MTNQDLHNRISEASGAAAMCIHLVPAIMKASEIIALKLKTGGKIITCGNGGSAAQASHFATEFMVRFDRERKPLPAVCLNDSGATLTASVNDYQPEGIFMRQIHALCHSEKDVLVVFSTSGNSKNIFNAILAASCFRIAILGGTGGICGNMAGLQILAPGNNTARIQETQLLISHLICECVEERMKE